MHLTREADYAVRVVVDLAGRERGGPVRTEDLTRSTGVPAAYLKKIIQALARAHLVQTRQGPGGGVFLHRDAATITLRDIVEAIEGRIQLNRCLVRAGECERDTFCPAHPVWRRVQTVLLREMEAVSARDLAGPPGPPDVAAAGAPGRTIGVAAAVGDDARPRNGTPGAGEGTTGE